MKSNPEEIKEEKKPRRRSILFWIGRALLYFIIFIFGLIIFIQLPPVQKMGARKLSSIIGKTLNTSVSIGGFNLHPLSDLSLKDVHIGSPDYPLDTLINAKTLNVDFHRLWSLLSGQLTINQIIIDEGYLNIEKKTGDTLTNLDVAMLRLLPAKDTSKAAFVLDLDKISATKLQVKVNDHTTGSLINMLFDRADVSLDTLDMEGQYIRADYMDFDRPLIYVKQQVMKESLPLAPKKTAKHWSFDVGDIKWTDGKFYVDNDYKPRDTSQVFGIDYAHLVLIDVDISAKDVHVSGPHIRGSDIAIHILHQNGFEIRTAAAREAVVSPNGIHLTDLEIETNDSHIRNSIELQFSGFDDFKSFADSVVISMPDAEVRLHVKDLLAIVPALGKADFFNDNKDKSLFLHGNVQGHINRLRILGMNAGMGGITLIGDFRSRNLAVSGSQLLSLDLEEAIFSAVALKDLFPRMNIPPILNRLGQIRFKGKFDGYPDDFVAFGNFRTALGAMTMDMNLNLVRGISNARYSGTFSMDNFDLGRLIDSKDIGRASMTARIIEGKGLSAETVEADITAVMSSIVYKGYTYRNARLDGQVSGRLFTGTMAVHDPNVDMVLEGTIDYTGRSPKFDFVSRIDSIRFLPLGFGSKTIDISGYFDVNFTAGSIDEFKGTIIGEDIVVRIDSVDYYIDSLYADAVIDTVTGDRFYHIRSNIMSGVFSGVFNPLTIPNYVHQYLYAHYPSSIGPPQKILPMDDSVRISWDLRIHDSGVWLDMIGLPGLNIRRGYTHGSLDLNARTINGFIELPELHYGGFNVYGSKIDFDESNGKFAADVEVIAADFKEDLFFEDVSLKGSGTDDSLRVRIQTDHIAEIIDELDVELFADPENGVWSFSINPIRLEMLGDSWLIPPGNRVQIRNKSFTLENFELVSGDRRIVLDDINHKGLEAFITGFDVDYLNTLWVTDKFEFGGNYTLDLEIDNLYDIQQMSIVLHVPALRINNQPYGEWQLNASMKDPKDSVRIDLAMAHNETQLIGKGAFLPPIKSIPKEEQNYLRMAIDATEFPLDFLEFLMGGNIRDTEGSVDLDLTLTGKVNRLNPNGRGKVYNGSTTIDYLGTAYSFHDQSFTITESMIDLSGTRLYDVQGNVATVEGGITHRYLKNLGLAARVRSDRIIGLDVTSAENNNFYGFGIGSVDAIFSGTLANVNMDINVSTAEGTHIYIPLSGGTTTADKDFVVFLENGKLPVSRIVPFNLGGINLTMNLNITPVAIVEIIFDDNTGEVLQASGEGNLQIAMNRTGNLTMTGTFQVTEGDYLFTNFFFIRKSFEIKPGGTIRWTGDPYDAELNVQAVYSGLSAPIYPLIQEYLIDEGGEILADARERTPVELTMILRGSLLHPDIEFDIAFPELTGIVRSYAEAKVRLLKDQSAMFGQVMGLLVTRSFLPTSGLNTLQAGISETLSEMFSSALSSYLSGLLGDIIPQGQFLSGVDFYAEIDLGGFQSDVQLDELNEVNTSQYRVALPLEFFNDRLSLTVGGNYVRGASYSTEGESFAGDVTFEWKLTPDGRLRIRAYNRSSESIETEGHRKNKIGAGLVFRREYDSFSEIFSRKRKKKPEAFPEPDEGG